MLALLGPLVLSRVYSVLYTLYMLATEAADTEYWARVRALAPLPAKAMM